MGLAVILVDRHKHIHAGGQPSRQIDVSMASHTHTHTHTYTETEFDDHYNPFLEATKSPRDRIVCHRDC